jgi:hypothetical protein
MKRTDICHEISQEKENEISRGIDPNGERKREREREKNK